ncbi:HAD-IB family phosphatase [Allofrancisella guangzhouensis]|uniref:phosphoserine phosphatase n=1 Tax=Allofrancisella guangzhouensis TaxID=594679 RepID=A0A0A8E5K2_9GAMM|nr:HAD-IB family phosphatase [Allofrancisella guangzhouensis]AJC48877.1 phosphoserine phosphatase [Allofrancisella guangzhouensis]MBK2027418.1 HAD-IB family phosphatase [Allofrancisella guangzhouensis]MBK2043404.1 HAD-IB family phosphatase [Allofrancisella guangzhouensis]MBK2045829.1 HAD-IB family phosphatase [Allofrancisella guangzhouensis]
MYIRKKNIIFDFDSTLIKKESLELILEPILKEFPDKLKEIEDITNLGMQGQINFRKSLEKRLAIASPTKASIEDFVIKHYPNLLTVGILELIIDLKQAGFNIWIFSGGLTDCIIPFAEYLGITKNNIFAVDVVWAENGGFYSLDNTNGACDSKLSAFEKVKSLFVGEVIVVGDGYTDYQLYESGFVDKFIVYTEHVVRENVTGKAKHIANNIHELRDLLLL